ncbi:DUF2891 domain-containing protein [Luteimonas abyssi]|uniref:DUF2891 domain-containing protein n=1 Tax=Luteimonas abyssi TaxID=1247514 RepID=UPI00192E315B|nr:DUF2891 domain-containing protein [Luteimonas abyssi]
MLTAPIFFAPAAMSGVRAQIEAAPSLASACIGLTFACKLGLQVLDALAFPGTTAERSGAGLVPGNRNVGLVWSALGTAGSPRPAPYFAATQFPIYITPRLTEIFARRAEKGVVTAMTTAFPVLTDTLAARFAHIALGHVRREYPNKPGHVLAGPEDARTPSALHPLFYGSFDWHSCVHGYWMLARLLRRHPDGEAAADIRALFDAQFVEDKVAAECRYLEAPTSRGFERPYGWGWLLKLSAELSLLDGTPWHARLAPLAAVFVQRFRDFLPLSAYPVRVGTHFNTAFGLRMAADHAVATQDAAFASLLRETALRWYGEDADCPAWGEPGGDDFQSSALIEAECMRRLLAPADFLPWFDRFLPRLADRAPATLFSPVAVSDRTDGKIAHLDGLNLSRAWCWRALAQAVPGDDVRRAILLDAAHRHLDAGLPHVAGDYMGEHWLASFAVLAIDEA